MREIVYAGVERAKMGSLSWWLGCHANRWRGRRGGGLGLLSFGARASVGIEVVPEALAFALERAHAAEEAHVARPCEEARVVRAAVVGLAEVQRRAHPRVLATSARGRLREVGVCQ